MPPEALTFVNQVRYYRDLYDPTRPSPTPPPPTAGESSAPVNAPAPTYSLPPLVWSHAVIGDPTEGLQCTSVTGAAACFQPHGDTFWVKDSLKDSHSATALWEDYDGSTSGQIARRGICINSHGEGVWAKCTMNFSEIDTIQFRSRLYDLPRIPGTAQPAQPLPLSRIGDPDTSYALERTARILALQAPLHPLRQFGGEPATPPAQQVSS